MNARTTFPAAATHLATHRRTQREDRQFLPAALEILETPPSPIRIWFLLTICLLVSAAIAWGWFGRLDVIAIAQGKIQPNGRVKVIQPLEPGRVSALPVENGQRVQKGEPLVLFDSGETDADVARLSAELHAAMAEAARRRAAIVALSDRVIEPVPAIEWPVEVPPPIRDRETKVLGGDLRQLESLVSGYQAELRQKQRERERFVGTVDALSDLVATLQMRVDMRASLKKSGSGSMADVIDALQSLQEQKAALAENRGQIAESAAAIEVLTLQIEDAYRRFVAENLQKLAEAERRADDSMQLLAKARLRRERTVLQSPIDGTVSALSLTTVGQVVAAGQEVMRIIPTRLQTSDDAGTSALPDIEIEAYIANRDISFVRPGQEAVVKVESLPFTRYGTVPAKLIKIAGDAIPEPDADRLEGNPTQSLRDWGQAGAQRTQNLVFPATFRLEASDVEADGSKVPLSPGMAVTVEIKTGSRRILEYLFSPLVEIGSSSLRER